MKNISEYINESGYDEIIRKNLAEISDEDITNEVRDYEGDNLSQKDILTIWNHLKSLNSNKIQAWICLGTETSWPRLHLYWQPYRCLYRQEARERGIRAGRLWVEEPT